MTHDELLAKMDYYTERAQAANDYDMYEFRPVIKALRAVVELHKPVEIPSRGITACDACVVTISTKINPLQNFEHTAFTNYPCKTIQAIEKELK